MSNDDTEQGEHEITAQDIQQRGDMALRQALVAAIDSKIGGGQDKYDTFNWDKNPTVEDFYGAYLRNAYARAVCDMPVETTWRDPPKIEDKGEDSNDNETEFEEAVDKQADELDVNDYFRRIDVLAGIGEYGIMVLEFDDTNGPDDFEQEVDANSVSELIGIKVYSQASVDTIEVGGPGSGRWGKPVEYTVDLSDEDDDVTHQGPPELTIHHSRVIHVPSQGLLDDEIRGTPRMEPIWNNLTDIERALGSAGELAYRASAWGLNINIDKDYRLEDEGEKQNEHLQRWYYGLEPILRTEGADEVQSLGGEEINPQLVIDPNIEAISAEKEIPQSVLKGNETGERATEQDLKEYYGSIQGRRNSYSAPRIVQQFYDRQLEYGTLPKPVGQEGDEETGGYLVEWDPLAESDQLEEAETQKVRAEMLNTLPTLTDALDEEQMLEFVEDGTLPNEIDVSSIEESELEPPEMPVPPQQPPQQPEAPPAQPPEQPAVPDGGEESEE